MPKKIRKISDLEQLQPIELPAVGSVVNIVAMTNKGKHWVQPARVVSTHTKYIVVRAIPDPPFNEDTMLLQQYTKTTHHRVRHDGSISTSEWLDLPLR